jgi:hypothetical protein
MYYCDYYPKQGIKLPVGTLISEKQVENIRYKFKMVKVETFFENGINSLVPGEEERTSTFNLGAARVYIGYNSKGEHIKLVFDADNDKNPKDIAFIIYLD